MLQIQSAFERLVGGGAVGLVTFLVGCMPLEDLSSYASSRAEQTPPSSPKTDAGAWPVPSPPAVGAVGAPEADVPEPLTDGGVDAGLDAAALGRANIDADAAQRSAPTPAGLDAGAPADGLPGVLVGASRQNLTAGGLERSFLYYAPAGLDPDLPAPVLIVAHGFGQTAAELFDITRFDLIAEREGFVVLYPDGQGRVPWNIGEDVCPAVASRVASAAGDDAAFLDAMLAFVAADRRVDETHVFVSGLAGGGYLANELGCQRPDIRAIVSHSGGSHPLEGCASARKPVLLLHGLADPTVSSACSAEARDRWVEHNGCAPGVATLAIQGGTCDVSIACPAEGQVVFCTFDGMLQGWAGGSVQDESFLAFASASEQSWEFFQTYAW